MPSIPPLIGNLPCIVMHGTDARSFAQAQFSGDVDALAPGQWQWNAWLDAQGRVHALMHLIDPGDGTLLAVLRGGEAEAIRSGLARYLLRAQVTLALVEFAGRAGAPAPVGNVDVQPDGTIALGYGSRSLRLHPGRASTTIDAGARNRWQLADIRQGWPTLPGGDPTGLLAPALGLKQLGAASLTKGCYPGQEIVARLHYRGGHKYRLCRLTGAQPLSTGTARDAAGAIVARILSVATVRGTAEALAVIPTINSNHINILHNIYEVNYVLNP